MNNDINFYKKVGKISFWSFILIIGVGILLLTLSLLHKDYYEVKVRFAFIGNLKKGAPVKYISGLQVGYIKDIYHKDQGVEVILRLKKWFKLRKNAEISIYTIGMIGERFININQNNLSSEIVKPGETVIGNNAIGFEVIQQNLARFSEILMSKSISKSNKIKRFDKLLNSLAYNMAKFSYYTRKFRPTTSTNISLFNKKLLNFIDKLDDFKKIVDKFKKKEINITENDIKLFFKYIEVLNSTVNELNKSIEFVSTGSENITDMLTGIRNKKNYIGYLIYDDSLYEKINDTLEDIADFTEEMADNPSYLFNH